MDYISRRANNYVKFCVLTFSGKSVIGNTKDHAESQTR